jgi:hypothetical protein
MEGGCEEEGMAGQEKEETFWSMKNHTV